MNWNQNARSKGDLTSATQSTQYRGEVNALKRVYKSIREATIVGSEYISIIWESLALVIGVSRCHDKYFFTNIYFFIKKLRIYCA